MIASLESYFVPLFSKHIRRLRQVAVCHVQYFVIEHCLLVLQIWRIQTLLGIRFRGYSSDMEDTNALGYQVRRLFFRYGGYKRSWVSGSAVIVPFKRCFPFDSSVGRGEDCRLIIAGILRWLV